jgi:3-oxoacyl-[acyl-carrier protein] reductase
MTTSLAGRRAAVVGSSDPPADAIVAALRRAGVQVAAGPLDGGQTDGGLDLVVHIADCRGAERALVDLDEQAWDDAAEAPARALLATIQAAHAPLRRSGGRLVVVVPSAAREGAAGLVAETTGWEAMRLLAKSSARRWAEHGIKVHIVAVRIQGPPDAHRTEPVLGSDHASAEAVADVVVLLAAAGAVALTGQTLLVDGGALMLP